MLPADELAPAVRAALRERLERIPSIVRPEAVTLGWATVELERAEQAALRRLPGTIALPAPPDLLLGATARLVADADGRRPRLILLEPSTEGRLAASLARYGEGPVVVYLRLAAGSVEDLRATAGEDLRLSAPAPGPLGPSTLLGGGRAWGPHVILVEPGPTAAPSSLGAGTIREP